MSANANTKDGTKRPELPENWSDDQKSYWVVLEEIRSDVETPGSFAIKFSLLTKSPVSKMKHLVRNMPTPVWSGSGKSRAESVLALIEEAGGRGRIVEKGGANPAKDVSKDAKDTVTCRWCGFPVREGDTHCDFCMTALSETKKCASQSSGGKTARNIPAKRLLCYIVVLIAGIVFAIVAR